MYIYINISPVLSLGGFLQLLPWAFCILQRLQLISFVSVIDLLLLFSELHVAELLLSFTHHLVQFQSW